MNKKFLLIALGLFFTSAFTAFAQDAGRAQESYVYWRWISAAVSVGLSCIAGGIAVGQIGAAAMGAMSENPEMSGKALPFVGLAEGICLWGFLVALLILFV